MHKLSQNITRSGTNPAFISQAQSTLQFWPRSSHVSTPKAPLLQHSLPFLHQLSQVKESFCYWLTASRRHIQYHSYLLPLLSWVVACYGACSSFSMTCIPRKPLTLHIVWFQGVKVHLPPYVHPHSDVIVLLLLVRHFTTSGIRESHSSKLFIISVKIWTWQVTEK